MGRHDWYRSTEWNDAIEEAFMAKLKRARDKSEYLRIQAYYLEDSHPGVANRLLDMYFALQDQSGRSTAYLQKAEASIKLGQTEQAIEAFDAAVEEENKRPTDLSDVKFVYPLFVAQNRLRQHYSKVEKLFNQGEAVFHVHKFMRRAAQSFIAEDNGDLESAKKHAKIALWFAEQESSGFSYHPTTGLVDEDFRLVIAKLKELLSASRS